MNLGQKIYDTLEELSQFSQGGEGVTRMYLTKEHALTNEFLLQHMEAAGLTAYADQAGNVIGSYDCGDPSAKTLLVGSHQDTVRCGGKYDGALGVVLPMMCLGELIARNALHCNVKLLAFSDEEGTRFGTTFFGSESITGSINSATMERRDDDGISIAEALVAFGSDPLKIPDCKYTGPADGYLEVHIEQGPVLEAQDLPIGVVSAIQSTHRYDITINGVAGHAGTVPMTLRNDAAHLMSQAICGIMDYANSQGNLVATVGKIQLLPGSINVIPVKASFSLDIRSIDEGNITAAIDHICAMLQSLCQARSHCSFSCVPVNLIPPTYCSAEMVSKLSDAVASTGTRVFSLPSGAGHDAQEISKITDVCMLFMRCKDGVSHSPLEAVAVEDIEVTAQAVSHFIEHF